MSAEITRELEGKLARAVEAAFESEQVRWLKEIVEKPSHTQAKADVEAAAETIDALAEQIGLRRSLFPDPNGVFADHRVYSSPATLDGDSAIALVGHCDTVYPRDQGFLEFRRDPVNDSLSGDRVFGPGVLDMKSGLSVALFALKAVAETAPDVFSRLKLRFVCNTDEEVGSPSSHALFEQLSARTSEALVFEGGREGDRIITARKGTGGFALQATGRAAHAGNDHRSGINAIHALSLLVPFVEALTDYDVGTTVNVGVIAGGTAKNTVPDKAQCEIDVRVSTMQQAQFVQEQLQALADGKLPAAHVLPERLGAVQFDLFGGMRRLPMEPSAESQALRLEYESFAARHQLGTGEAPLQGGGSDANLLAAFGVPTIDGLGPYGTHMHSVQEWSSLSSLCKRTKALACFLVHRGSID